MIRIVEQLWKIALSTCYHCQLCVYEFLLENVSPNNDQNSRKTMENSPFNLLPLSTVCVYELLLENVSPNNDQNSRTTMENSLSTCYHCQLWVYFTLLEIIIPLIKKSETSPADQCLKASRHQISLKVLISPLALGLGLVQVP